MTYQQRLPKLTKKTLADDFIEQFERMIITGELKIGEILPSERDLATKLGVSRPVVHEGLIHLETKGLISRNKLGGAVVNDYRKEGSLFMLDSLLTYHAGDIEPNLAESTMDFRYLVEVELARLAALRRTPEQLNELQGLLMQETITHPRQQEALAEIDFRFHHQIALSTGNIFYPLLLNSFKPLYINGSRMFFSDPAMAGEVFAFHRQLVTSIEKQDSQGAAEIMRRLLEHGKGHYITLMQRQSRKE